jgi:molybdopterin-guanine dinucleotide biosynthesis protein A
MMDQAGSLSEVTLAVLAGGRGSRMGIAKDAIHIEGKPILRRLHRKLVWPGPTILVTAPGRERPDGAELFNLEAIDAVPAQGPLRGVLTALEHANSRLVIVIPIDMPNLNFEVLRWMVESFRRHRPSMGLMLKRRDAVNSIDEKTSEIERIERIERIEPLPAVFDVAGSREQIRSRLAGGSLSLQGLAKLPGMMILDAPSAWARSLWVNLNRPADVHEWELSSAGADGEIA